MVDELQPVSDEPEQLGLPDVQPSAEQDDDEVTDDVDDDEETDEEDTDEEDDDA